MDVTLIYERLIKLNKAEREKMSRPEQFLFFIVTAGIANDMDGFCSIFEQTLTEKQLGIVIDGLRTIDEKNLADAFIRCRDILVAERYYEHNDCRKVPKAAWEKIDEIGDEIGDRLANLDDKLEALMDGTLSEKET